MCSSYIEIGELLGYLYSYLLSNLEVLSHYFFKYPLHSFFFSPLPGIPERYKLVYLLVFYTPSVLCLLSFNLFFFCFSDLIIFIFLSHQVHCFYVLLAQYAFDTFSEISISVSVLFNSRISFKFIFRFSISLLMFAFCAYIVLCTFSMYYFCSLIIFKIVVLKALCSRFTKNQRRSGLQEQFVVLFFLPLGYSKETWNKRNFE